MTDIIRHTCTYRVTDLQKYLDSIEELDAKLETYGMNIIARDHLHNDVFCLICDIDHDHPDNEKIMRANEEFGWEYKMLEVPISEISGIEESSDILSNMKTLIKELKNSKKELTNS